MSILEPCLSCEHAKEQRPNEKMFFCAARMFNLMEDVEIFPVLCTYFTPRDGK